MTSSDFPRMTFGIILLNGQPFIRYNLRALYPFAHEIIVVEGAVPAAAEIATVDGNSTDGSLEELYRFKEEEDPENKIEIVTRDGFWSEKDEMSQAYAQRAKGDYLWQVDIDEFYHPEDMRFIIEMLANDPAITAVSFRQITFWGGFDYITDGWYLRRGANTYHRLFRWEPGYTYTNHRPPTVLDQQGRNLRDMNWINGSELAAENIYLFHYSLLFSKQVDEKSAYYGAASWARRPHAEAWAQEAFYGLHHPYHVHNVYQYPSWLESFTGRHPPQIDALRADIETGQIKIATRPHGDIDRLLSSNTYRLGRAVLKITTPLATTAARLRRRLCKR